MPAKQRANQFWMLVGALALAACAAGRVAPPVVLAPDAAAVRTGKADPPIGATELGAVSAVNGKGCGTIGEKGTYEGAYNLLRNKAEQMGATYVRIDIITEPHSESDCYDDRFIIRGTAYRTNS